MNEATLANIIEYHDRTKHRFSGYAKGPANIDWDAQPDSFRTFAGALQFRLPLTADSHRVPFSALFDKKLFDNTHARCEQATLTSIALLLEISVALSAWKQYGHARWSLRCNPSSGNLHPTETYVVVSNIDDLPDGVYHYRADQHALEQRCVFNRTSDTPAVFIGFSSVHWREAWKYGERAYRYCQHDVGHAMAAVSYAAATLGWHSTPQATVGDAQLAQLLGIDRDNDFINTEREHPDLLLQIGGDENAAININELLSRCGNGVWHGTANTLDRHHVYDWPVIDAAAAICIKPAQADSPAQVHDTTEVPALPLDSAEPAADLFRRRRSAQAFDGNAVMPRQDFFRMLDHVLPRQHLAPWNCAAWLPRIHLVLFVHRVDGLSPGLYALPRHANARHLMQAAMREDYAWAPVESAPEQVPLYRLLTARTERAATTLCCQQAIAGESVFSLAMLAEFEPHLVNAPWRYRELFHEAGAIGQALYLEAEASGLRGTGIGCYFDDEVHEVLGITNHSLQSVYHFTVGQPLLDSRIVDLPPYDRFHND